MQNVEMKTQMQEKFEAIMNDPKSSEALKALIAKSMTRKDFWVIDNCDKVSKWKSEKQLVEFPYRLYFQLKSFGWINEEMDAQFVKIPGVLYTNFTISEYYRLKIIDALKVVINHHGRASKAHLEELNSDAEKFFSASFKYTSKSKYLITRKFEVHDHYWHADELDNQTIYDLGLGEGRHSKTLTSV